MKLLLTSGGITNDTLAGELEGLTGKKFAELAIGFIPSAAFGDPSSDKSWLINDLSRLQSRGAKVAIISLADLTPDEIVAQLQSVDVIFVGGGNTFYLSWLLKEKRMSEILAPLLQTKVYAGISAGSMITTSNLAAASQAVRAGEVRGDLGPAGRSGVEALNLVPFLVRPHLNNHLVEEIANGALEKIADRTGLKIYAIDDQCAVRVVDDEVSVVGEGEWRVVEPVTPGSRIS